MNYISLGVSILALVVSIWSYRDIKKTYDKIEARHRERVNKTEHDFLRRS